VPTSLRLRLIVSITLVFLVILLPGSVLVYLHAVHEVEVELRAAVSVGTNTVHNAVDDAEEAERPLRHLELLIEDFNGDRHLRAALVSIDGRPLYRSTPLPPTDPPPEWFYRLLARRSIGTVIHLPDPFNRFGTVLLQADARNEISEVWDDAVLTLAILLTFCGLNAALVYWITGRALRPLQTVSAAFDRLGEGHYRVRVPESGPRELEQVSRGLNRLAGQLANTEAQRLKLEQQLADVQEEERADLARDLHDEIGPLLFAVGADLSVIQHDESVRNTPLESRVGAVRETVARIYQDIKAILGRLRTSTSPLELGLSQAVQNLLAFWRARYPAVHFECEIAQEDFGPAIDDALYHVIMEGLSNALRHGSPTSLCVRVAVEERQILATVRDNGSGFTGANTALSGGFGIASMEQRIRSLAGSLSVSANSGGPGVTVTARVPLNQEDEPAAAPDLVRVSPL
jgi:two-component system, NarL family, sensor histidine kinase UhpB